MSELHFFTGTMDSGKSTLALQLNFTYEGRSVPGRLYTRLDRNGDVISSRIGLSARAIPVTDALDLFSDVEAHLPLSYVICDEAQFYTNAHIEQLGTIVDHLDVDVFAFGILSDFTGHLFPAAQRLFELADRRIELPAPALCWCGRRGTHNARIEDGEMVTAGSVVAPTATYHVVCRKHFFARQGLDPHPHLKETARMQAGSQTSS